MEMKLDRHPETRLWQAVIHQAVCDISGKSKDAKENAPSALRWFNDPSERPGSFRWACRTTKLNERLILNQVSEIHATKIPDYTDRKRALHAGARHAQSLSSLCR